MQSILLVALGGAIGSVARYLAGLAVVRATASGFPWATLGVNVIGSLIMGLLAALMMARHGAEASRITLFFMTGVLGGFTTFSAFSLDVVMLVERGRLMAAAGYAGASVALSVLALTAGLALARGLA